MPETKTKTRKLAESEAPALYALARKVSEQQAKIRSADQNLASFSDFADEADAMIAALPDGPDKDSWAARKAHCQGPQTDAEKVKKAAANALLAKSRPALEAEKAKYEPSLAQTQDGWTVSA